MNGKRILITGMGGFIGSRLACLLSETFPGANISGIVRPLFEGDSSIHGVDLMDTESLTAVIKTINPDYIFHLAGNVHSHDLDELYRGNVEITVNIMEAVLASAPHCRVIIPGSAAEYGQVSPGDLPITENQPQKPVSLYGVVKSWQTTAAVYYASRGVDTVVGRIFNIIGRGMSEGLAVGAFAAQLKKIKKGESSPWIKVGNLAPKRDFLDIDDVSRALIALALKGKSSQIYNICSGVSTPMSEILSRLIVESGIAAEAVIDEKKFKAADIADSRGSYYKLKMVSTWKPAVALSESLKKLMN